VRQPNHLTKKASSSLRSGVTIFCSTGTLTILTADVSRSGTIVSFVFSLIIAVSCTNVLHTSITVNFLLHTSVVCVYLRYPHRHLCLISYQCLFLHAERCDTILHSVCKRSDCMFNSHLALNAYSSGVAKPRLVARFHVAPYVITRSPTK